MWIRYRLDRMNRHGVPDLSDPATVGALLALVREVAQEPGLPRHERKDAAALGAVLGTRGAID
jgi:hypothetical protein